MIKFEKVSKKFANGTVAIDSLNLFVDNGEFVFITGPSGAGKTTLLKLITRELFPSSGKIFFKGEEIASLKKSKILELRRQIGAVFQDFKLLAESTVFENVALGLEIMGKKEKEIKQKVEQVLDLVALQDKANLFPRQLAGGELQRVTLARALAFDPKLIFADEPTGNLDPQTSWQIIDLLKKVNKQGITLIMATHNFDIVDSLSQRVVRLEKGKLVSDEKKGKYRK